MERVIDERRRRGRVLMVNDAGLVAVIWLALTGWAHGQTLHAQCAEQTKTLTLTGSDAPDAGRMWNVERDGVRLWNYEGEDYEIPLGRGYTAGFSLTLNRFACSDHFSFYYTNEGSHSVTQTYVEQVATQLETAWTELSDNQGFRSPLELKVDGRYEHFDDFLRVPVLILNTADGRNHANDYPFISIVPGLSAASGSPHHELFHVIKHGYTRFSRAWLNEGLARWSEKFGPGSPPCAGFTDYRPITFNLLARDYCDSASFFNYLGLKYSAAAAGGDGSDVVRAILDEMADVESGNRSAMQAIERALDSFGARSSGYGIAYKEWAKGNYVDDTGESPVARPRVPARPRWTEAGEIGRGADRYVWHDFPFTTKSRGTITIQIRAAAGDLDRDGDDDDLRFRMDGTLLGNWDSDTAFDGSVLNGSTRTIHIIRRDVPTGSHTLRLEADEHPILLSVNVYSGEIPLLLERAGALDNASFELLAGVAGITALLGGRAESGDDSPDDNARVSLDGAVLAGYDTEGSLDGDVLVGNAAAVEVQSGALAAGKHLVTVQTTGTPAVDYTAVFPTPSSLPLLRLNGGRLSEWSTNYHVIRVGAELLPSGEDVPAPANLTIELGTYEWSREFEPPFHHVLLIDAAGNLHQSLTGDDSHSVRRSITPATLNRLGVGGSVVVVVGTREASGTYFIRVRR